MRKFELAAIFAALLAAPAALAQESGTGGQAGHMAGQGGSMTDLSILPQGCQDAIQQSGMPGMMQGMDMSGMMGGMEGMDEAQQASMQAMMEMNGPMMATHTIKDPDLAFHCGMIACRVVLKSETARAGGYSLPLNVRFCFRKQRASQVSFHYLINCGKQTWLLSIGAQ
jgi:hypothetical protein